MYALMYSKVKYGLFVEIVATPPNPRQAKVGSGIVVALGFSFINAAMMQS